MPKINKTNQQPSKIVNQRDPAKESKATANFFDYKIKQMFGNADKVKQQILDAQTRMKTQSRGLLSRKVQQG